LTGALIGLLSATSVATQAPLLSPPPEMLWRTACANGTDGFAVNCTAARAMDRYVVTLVTADSQLFVYILHPSCTTDFRNFDRTDLAGLPAAERRALIERAFHEIEGEIRRKCPTLTPPPFEVDGMPDIVIYPNHSDN